MANAGSQPVRPLARASTITSTPLPPPGSRFAAPATASPVLKTTPLQSAAIASAVPTGTARNLARAGNWTPVGGTPIVVAKGESIGMIERRYGVPGDTLLKVNGLRSASQVVPGTRLTIPVYDASGKVSAKTPSRGDSTASIRPPGRQAAPVPATRPASIQKQQKRVASLRTTQSDASPVKDKAAARLQARKDAAEQARKKREALAARKAAEKTERAEKAAAAPGSSTNPDTTDRKPVASIAKPAKSADEAPGGNFRWPAKGRIIQGYRKGQNDGINIAVPEGAAIKAAENGVVAYAGSELKGYGNLVLIRHPNGYVSAYAHNSQLKVKRGDQVRRGQTIAAAGRTGNVSTPQLHFELRKGADPVNPVKLLGSN